MIQKNKILNGIDVSKIMIKKIKNSIINETGSGKRFPSLAMIWINNNESSKLYVKKKNIACQDVGISTKEWIFDNSVQEKKIIELIKTLNNDEKIDGILIQLPLPNHINPNNIFKTIHPKKDVDGFHPYNIGCLCQKTPKLRPCTSKGIITLLNQYKIRMQGLHATIIGASNIVGRPMALELLFAGCTITITHRFTKNIKKHTKKSDIIIIGIGKPNFLNDQDVKSGSIIIDVGINKLPKEKKIYGDVNFKSVFPKVSYITPVPGGVGPMTVATLLENTLEAYQNKHQY
ncbi:bifunctional methylenetetrahydrofolate dehydrogenase/methenyltetrahydrofolate cyclohydrolase FolD [Buchnera aphidicola]|uniref:bifunctional methylenetetrahydrofolate dehydrogenase/methenyltetrahydrofolate cyclohydrolase FolD n=1 Tax=Buchnera aphidicola TaxID=9 RepID=UPI00346420BD